MARLADTILTIYVDGFPVRRRLRILGQSGRTVRFSVEPLTSWDRSVLQVQDHQRARLRQHVMRVNAGNRRRQGRR